MSSDQSSLHDRYRDDLRSGSLPVLLTAVPIAIVAGIVSGWYWDAFAASFLLLVTVGVMVPYAHETGWPQDRRWSRDVPWTITASAVACGLFAGGYLLGETVLTDPTHNAVVAFGVTLLVGWIGLRLLQRKL